MKGGRIVPEAWSYTRPDGTVIAKEDTVRPISVYDYELEKNDQKRNIYLLRKQYLSGFVEEFSNLVQYLPNLEVNDEDQIKKSFNTTQEQFQSVKPTYSTNIGQTSSIEFASEADYSSKTFDTSGASISEGDVLADGSTVVTTTTTGAQDNTTSNSFGSSGY